ncbi:hypothetical protein HUU39_05605 [candidate division KSB1 bacterium]|nr:hypothetical protein [bacterium]NUM64737.1 hypothetical protein [candidate division KSB1 bacterium]
MPMFDVERVGPDPARGFAGGEAQKKKRRLLCAGFGLVVVWSSLSPLQAQPAVMRDLETPLYEMPSITSHRLLTLSAGDTVRILQNRGLWMQLATHTDQKGWMFLGKTEGQTRKPRPPALLTAPAPAVEGGVSAQVGVFDRGFTVAGRFSYRSLARVEVEAALQYVNSKAASFHLLHTNVRYLQPLASRVQAALTAGAGVIHSTAEATAGSARSALMINYGVGVQRRLGDSHWLRAEVRRVTAFTAPEVTNYTEFLAGFTLGMAWSRL